MIRLRNVIVVLIPFLLFAAGVRAGVAPVDDAPVTVRIGQSSPIELASRNARFWVESGQVDIARLFEPGAVHWQRITTPSINVGWHSHRVWLRFTVENVTDQPQSRLLELRWTNLSDVEYYQQRQPGSEPAHYRVGPGPLSQADYRPGIGFLFPIELAPHERSQILLGVSSRLNLFLPLFIWKQQAYQSDHATRVNWYCVAFGVLLALTLYNASLYAFTRDRSYLYYSLYALSIIVYELGITGLGNRYLWGEIPWLRFNGLMLGVHLSFLCAAVFAMRFLDIKAYSNWMYQLGRILILYWIVSLAFTLLGFNLFMKLALVASFVSCICAVVVTVYLWIRGNVSAKYFTIAWGALLGFTMVTVMMMQGLLRYTPLTEFGQMIGFVAEMLLLSLALAERINRERRQREESQREALALQVEISSEREAKLQVQEELMALQKEANQALESRVAERTRALDHAMAELEKANLELANLSVTDPLTRVHNRRYFDEVLPREIQRAERGHHAIALILVDIDHFKQFNDNYGHLVGDDCLRIVASTLQNVVTRSADLIARYGGEEFAVVLPETDEADAYRLAEKIREAILNVQFIYGGKRIPISASLGVVGVIPERDFGPRQLIMAADKALYRAKHLGRNCSVAAGAASAC